MQILFRHFSPPFSSPFPLPRVVHSELFCFSLLIFVLKSRLPDLFIVPSLLLYLCVYVSPLCFPSSPLPASYLVVCVLGNGCDIYGQKVLRPATAAIYDHSEESESASESESDLDLDLDSASPIPGLIKYWNIYNNLHDFVIKFLGKGRINIRGNCFRFLQNISWPLECNLCLSKIAVCRCSVVSGLKWHRSPASWDEVLQLGINNPFSSPNTIPWRIPLAVLSSLCLSHTATRASQLAPLTEVSSNAQGHHASMPTTPKAQWPHGTRKPGARP